jgi:hypothetical protein
MTIGTETVVKVPGGVPYVRVIVHLPGATGVTV